MEEEIEEIEVWKDCGEGPKKKYQVSNLGRVKSIIKVNNKEKILKGTDAGNGYLRVDISKKKTHIHTLVALAFLGPRPDGLVIDHFDRSRANNKIDNLRYCTISGNNINSDNYRDDILEQGVERRKVFQKEWYEANREAISERYEANREAISEKRKEKYTCSCGVILRKDSKSRHERSQTHKAYLENLNK